MDSTLANLPLAASPSAGATARCTQHPGYQTSSVFLSFLLLCYGAEFFILAGFQRLGKILWTALNPQL